ncbi:MAG: DMT family transporter [Myxococcales bacterium]|nr:DMT family transporter [Myxococcales bacterium]
MTNKVPKSKENLVVEAALLLLGVACLSTAAVIIRAADAPPAVLALHRLGYAALLLLPARPRLSPLSLLAGVSLALHFWAWNASLRGASVTSATTLVTLTPLILGVAGPRIPGATRLSPYGWLGLFVALAGAAILSGGPPTSAAWLAILAAALIIPYLSASTQSPQSPLQFSASSALVGALTLAILLALSDTPLSLSPRATALALALAVVPQILGHTLMLRGARCFGATVTSVAVLLEPLGAAILAAALLAEPPTPSEVRGGLLLLAGVALATLTAPARVPGPLRD